MALLKFKRSAVPAKVPSIADLDLGELAINTYDGKVYIKKDDGAQAIIQINIPSLTAGYLFKSNGASPASASIIYDNGTNIGVGVIPPTTWNAGGNAAIFGSGGAFLHGTGGSTTWGINARYQSGWKYVLTGAASRYYQASGEHIWFNAASGTAGAAISFFERMRIDASGNVLINRSSTSGIGKLNVEGGADVTSGNVTIQAGYGIAWRGDQTRIMTPEDNVYGALINWSAAGGCRFIAGTSERMRIDGSGNLLVGTTTSFGKLSVFGTAGFNADANSSISGSGSYKFRGAAAGTTITTYDYLNYTAMQFIRDNGNPTNTVGSITCTDTATAYNTSSDYRLKDIDGPIANSGAYLDALKPVQGSWKSNGSRFIGLLAHEVQEVSETPIATGEKDGEEMQAMDYSAPEIIANLIAEIQSLRARMAQLEGN